MSEATQRVVDGLREYDKAVRRLVIDKYPIWQNAGGPNECKHRIAAGIPCRACDTEVFEAYEPIIVKIDERIRDGLSDAIEKQQPISLQQFDAQWKAGQDAVMRLKAKEKETPRTDANVKLLRYPGGSEEHEFVEAEFARGIERELICAASTLVETIQQYEAKLQAANQFISKLEEQERERREDRSYER